MEKQVDFEVVRDCEVMHFMPDSFGHEIDSNVDLQRRTLVDGCQTISSGQWVGRSLYSVLRNMGLVESTKNSKLQGTLTMRGSLFLKQEKSYKR